MESDVLMGMLLLGLGIAFFLYFLFGVTLYLIEPVFMNVFGRPFYVHFYPRLRILPAHQKRFLDRISFYRRLSDRRKQYFEHRVARFISHYSFHGKGGLAITDEMQVLIAGTHVMLTFGLRQYRIPSFTSILVYPDIYRPLTSENDHKGEFNPRAGVVVFSWKHFVEGLDESTDNLNLGIHEFAHALHHHGMQRRDTAAAHFAARYTRIMHEVQHPPNARRLIESSYFRIYAYTNKFEFLAVILEHFFETPDEFRREFPELYESVRRMINLDTAAHFRNAKA